MTVRIGLTGGIGSGKSAVAELLRARGALVVDADAIAREVLAPGEPALSEVGAAFGPGVIRGDGTLDRAALAALVFGAPDLLGRLNAITHPRIAARMQQLLDAAGEGDVAVYDSALLVETGGVDGWDLVVVVDCPDELRIQRLVEQRHMDPDDARQRLAAQASREERVAAADVVIDNSGDRESLRVQVDALWDRIAALPARGR